MNVESDRTVRCLTCAGEGWIESYGHDGGFDCTACDGWGFTVPGVASISL